jgi:hypothetical protein
VVVEVADHDLCLAFDESSRLAADATSTGAETTASTRHRSGCAAPQWPGWREILRMVIHRAGQLGNTPVPRNWPLTSGFAHHASVIQELQLGQAVRIVRR